MKRTIFSLVGGAALLFVGAACEQHRATELESGHGGAPKEGEVAGGHEPGTAAPAPHSSENVPSNIAGSGPTSTPKPDKSELQKAGTPAAPKFFPDSK
jgi:hypothetical protein